MSVPLVKRIKVYSRGVDHAADYRESSEISALLAERQGIRDDLRVGAALSDAARATLTAADARLIAEGYAIARNFPEFDATRAIYEAIGTPILSVRASDS